MESPRKEQVYDTAGRLFSQRGYAATSMRDIARELDILGGSLYAHVSSKEDLLWGIISDWAERFFSAVRPWTEAELPAAERLEGMLRAHVQVVIDHIERATVFLRDWQYLSSPRHEQIATLRDEYEQIYRTTIKAGVTEGALLSTNPNLTATLILASLNSMTSWYRASGELGAGAIADQYVQLLLQGLLRR